MMTGKIRIAQEDFDIHMMQLEDAKRSADILFEQLAYGLLVVEPLSATSPNQSFIEVMVHIADVYGKELINSPKQLLGLISDLAPEQVNDRRKLKLFFDIGAVDILIGNGLKDEERVISIAKSELGFEDDDTRKLIHYLKPFIESCGVCK